MNMIPYENLNKLNQQFEADFKLQLSNLLQSGWYILGNMVQTFEQAFAKWHNVEYVVGVANGLDALILSLKALNLPPKSEVIVPSNTYIATILAIIQAGHIPVLVEPDLETYNISPLKIPQAITKNTKAIMVVHLYGTCAQMDKITAICKQHQLALIEDCAQAHGAKFNNQLAGTFGDMAAFSFYPTKNLGALGDAGAIICKTEQQYNTLKKLRNYGSGKKYYNELIGYNSRLDELQAAFLTVKLPALHAINNHKRQLASLYFKHLDANKFILPSCNNSKEYYPVYHIFNIRHARRDALKQYLLQHDIQTEIHYPIAPNQQVALKRMFIGQQFPISQAIHSTTLSLPCSYAHTKEDIMTVINVMNSFT